MPLKKGGLGMGLGALFEDNSSDVQVKKTLRVSEIEPNRAQPRKNFNESAIASLANSIKEHGIIQPLLVRPYQGTYQIVAGERRWRAAKLLGIDEVPVIIKEFNDFETMQIALIENLQREDLNPIEEAMSFKELTDKYNMKQEDLAKITGRSRSALSNSMRLLNLPDEVQDMLKQGSISVGHAKLLLGVSDENFLMELAFKAAEGSLTVRAMEQLIVEFNENPKVSEDIKIKKKDNYFKEMEISLHELLGRKVTVKGNDKGRGTIILEFYDKDDLNAIADKLIK